MDRQTIAVLSPLHGGPYFGPLLTGVRSVAAAAGIRVLAIQTLDSRRDYAAPDDSEFVSSIAWDHIDGFVVIINAVNQVYLDAIKAAGKPVVMISREVEGFACPVVVPDNRSGARTAVEHLIAHGHRRIAFAGSFDQPDIRERYEAYCAVLDEHGIGRDGDMVLETENNHELGTRTVAEAFAKDRRGITAIFTACDRNAIGFISALTEAGFVLPRDLSIASFDDLDICATITPALSSVSQNLNLIGSTAGSLVIQKLAGLEVVDGRHVVPASFIARESCGCSTALSFSAPVAAATPGPSGRLERFTAHLEAALPDTGDPGDRAAIANSAMTLAEVLEDAVLGTMRGSTPAVVEAVDALYRISPIRRSFIATTGSVLSLARELAQGPARGDAAAIARLDETLLEVTLAAHEVQMLEKHLANSVLRSSLRDEYDLSFDLLRSSAGHAQSLEWLDRMRVLGGVVAFWAPSTAYPHSYLRVAGTYPEGADSPAKPDSVWPIEQYPPPELLSLADDTVDDVVFLLPLRTDSADWGFFSVVGPVERSSATDREAYFQWAALLSVGLEHDQILQSLRQQQDDLTAAYARERELVETIRNSEERYALAARAANDGLWDWDVIQGSVYYSPRWKAMLGFDNGAVGDSPDEWLGRVHPDELPGLNERLDRGGDAFEYEHRVRARDGAYRWMLCRALAVAGEDGASRLVGSLTDITERKQLEDRLRHGALYDGLTDLPNRVLFVDRLTAAAKHFKRYPEKAFAVLFLDLDGFKDVNDSLGHAAGDLLLARAAERLRGQLRATDTAARIGGDEFAVLLTDLADLEMVPMIVDRIHAALAAPHFIDGHRVIVTASIGIATSGGGDLSPEDLLRHSDLAMYRAKTARRGTSATYDASMSSHAVERLLTAHSGAPVPYELDAEPTPR